MAPHRLSRLRRPRGRKSCKVVKLRSRSISARVPGPCRIIGPGRRVTCAQPVKRLTDDPAKRRTPCHLKFVKALGRTSISKLGGIRGRLGVVYCRSLDDGYTKEKVMVRQLELIASLRKGEFAQNPTARLSLEVEHLLIGEFIECVGDRVPEQFYAFCITGSLARREMGPHSDIDCFVIAAGHWDVAILQDTANYSVKSSRGLPPGITL